VLAIKSDAEMAGRRLLLFDVAIKGVLLGLLATALLLPQLPEIADQRMAWRALSYPLIIVVVPVAFVITKRVRSLTYPFDLDILLALPLVLDAAAPTFYDTVSWWDKFMHVVSWAVIGTASVRMLTRLPLARVAVASLAVAIGVATAALWELAEYLIWVRHSPQLLATAVADTRNDLICGVSATIVAVMVTVAIGTRSGATSHDGAFGFSQALARSRSGGQRRQQRVTHDATI
jgi:hypothetical protein